MKQRIVPSVSILAVTLVSFGALTLFGCAAKESVNEVLLMGQSADLIGLLDACAATSESRGSHICAGLADRVRPCTAVLATCPVAPGEGETEGCSLSEQLRCVDPSDPRLEELGADGGWLLRAPFPGTRGRGALEVHGRGQSGGGQEINVVVRADSKSGWARWLPGKDDPGPFELDGEGAFLHMRWHPDGGLLPERTGQESLADRLYGLRSQLFSAAVLTGDVELVSFVPSEGALIPGSAVALGFHVRRAAIGAMEDYIKDLQKEWPLTRTEYKFGDWQGACVGNLKVMPDLAPCYVATDRAIVVGWNRSSLEAALDSTPPGSGSVERAAPPDLGAWQKNRVHLNLQQLAVSDQRLAAGRGLAVAYHYPYSDLWVSGTKDGDVYHLEFLVSSEHDQ